MKVLLVEDDKTLREGIHLALREEGLDFLLCRNLKEAQNVWKEGGISLIILDINLPDGNGYQLLEEVRRESSVPVLILTANDMEMDEVTGFAKGADDYVTKPFSLAVLRARVQNLLKKRTVSKGAENGKSCVFQNEELFLDFQKMYFQREREELQFSRTEQKLLWYLVENPGRIFRRETLVDWLWTKGANYVDENALTVTISRIRSKLEKDPSRPRYIHTVYGIGYVWRDEKE